MPSISTLLYSYSLSLLFKFCIYTFICILHSLHQNRVSMAKRVDNYSGFFVACVTGFIAGSLVSTVLSFVIAKKLKSKDELSDGRIQISNVLPMFYY